MTKKLWISHFPRLSAGTKWAAATQRARFQPVDGTDIIQPRIPPSEPLGCEAHHDHSKKGSGRGGHHQRERESQNVLDSVSPKDKLLESYVCGIGVGQLTFVASLPESSYRAMQLSDFQLPRFLDLQHGAVVVSLCPVTPQNGGTGTEQCPSARARVALRNSLVKSSYRYSKILPKGRPAARTAAALVIQG